MGTGSRAARLGLLALVLASAALGAGFGSCGGKTCTPTDCGPPLGMPNRLCPDGKTVAGPTGRCLEQNGVCAWEVVSCPDGGIP